MSGLGASLRESLRRCAPEALAALHVFRQLRAQRRSFARAGRDQRSLAELVRQRDSGALVEIPGADIVDLVVNSSPLVALQKPGELLTFLERVGVMRPRAVLEIGTAGGGTLYLLTRVAADDAVVLSVDLSVPYFLAAARARLARAAQRVVSIEGNSAASEVRDRIAGLLSDRPLDVLLIDGDHSAAGVRTDFELYSPLVRTGGLIALHDIVPDDGAGPAVSGDVPAFWAELRQRYRTEEIVERDGRAGYGIGLVLP